MAESEAMVLRADGVITLWSLSDQTSLPAIETGLKALGLEAYTPHARTELAALRAALEVVHPGERTLIRPTKTRDGFVVVNEERREKGNDYRTAYVVRPLEDEAVVPSLDFEPHPGNDTAAKLLDEYERQRQVLPGNSVSKALIALLQHHLGATSLRERGGVYWLPGSKLPAWREVIQVVESSAMSGARNAVYVYSHRMDADAVRGVFDAICGEVSQEADRLQAEVFSGELGSRAMATRRDEAKAMRTKVKLYEELLGVSLGHLTQSLEKVETSLAASTLLAEPTPEESAA